MINPGANPVAFGDTLKTLLTAALAWVVIMRWWPLDPQQQAMTLTFGVALINAGISYWQNFATTPLQNPKDEKGEQLVRASDGEATRSAKKAGNG